MFRKDRLTAFGEQAGFTVAVETDVVRAIGVPCLLEGGVVGTCIIEKSYDLASAKSNDRIGGAVHGVRITTDEKNDRIGGAVHGVRITTDEKHDGLVYHADGTPIGNYIDGDGKTWSNISIKKGEQGSPEEDKSARDLIHRYAKHIVGAVSAAGYSETSSLAKRGPFKIPNTFEARAALGAGSRSHPPTADCGYWPGRNGRVRPGPHGEDTRSGDPSPGRRRS